MCRPDKWLWGLVPLALLAWFALGLREAPITQDLTDRANRELAAQGFGWARASLVGRDAVISGQAPTPEAKERAIALVDQVFGVRRVDDGLQVAAEVKPYPWRATRAGRTVTLSGAVPDEATRARLIAAAREAVPGADIVDQMQIGRGAPAGFATAAGFALGQLGRLTAGVASLADGAFTLTGEAGDAATKLAVATAARVVPQGFSVAGLTISAPTISPYLLQVVREGSTIALSGFVPDEAARQAALAAARVGLPSATVTDRLALGLGAPQNFAAMAAFVADAVGKLDPGSAQLSGNALTIQGQAPNAAVFDAVTSGLRQLPAGLTLSRADISPPVVRPFTWSATLSGGQVLLEGFVPTEAARAQIIERARAAAPGVNVVDRMRLGSGAPGAFGAIVQFALSQFPRLIEGQASLSDLALSLTGRGREGVDAAAIAAAAAASGGLPPAARLARNDVTASVPTTSPYVMTLSRSADGVTLDGLAPSEADKAAIADAARAALPGVAVNDRIRIALGAPAGMDWVTANRFALSQLARLRQGTARFVDQGFSIEGDAIDRPGWAAANQAVRATPFAGGARLVSADIRPPVASPFGWFVEKTASGVVLQGFVPSEAV
ncbi:MAG: BON domain-containing protein, partial [Alphaproteobacteria bacterium]